MLEKLFAKTLTLNINGEEISFNSLAEFEFALGGRTNVPATKLADLMMLPPADLKREAKSIKQVEKRFVDILSNSIEHPGEIGKLVREVDIQVFSNDFEWRAIFKALNQQQSDEYDELRRIAVVKYMQYLRSRQDVIKQTYKVKAKETAARDRGADRNTGQAASPESNPLEDTKDSLKETSIFDSISVEAPLEALESTFKRLPKGEAIIIEPPAGAEFEFRLSKHVFTFHNDDSIHITDNQGNEHAIGSGKTILGRDAVCNITVGTGLRDVSRMHLIIEPLEEGAIRFTDLSSHGSFLPSSLMPELEEF